MTNTLETGVQQETVSTQPEQQAGNTDQSAELLAGKFKSADDLANAYKELESKLGDLGNKAKQVETLSKVSTKYKAALDAIAKDSGYSSDELLAQLEDKLPKEVKDDPKSEVNSLKSKVEELEFNTKYPDAIENLSLIKAVAKDKGITLEEAMAEPAIKKILELEATTKSKSDVSVIETNKRIASDSTQKAQAFEKGIKTGNWKDLLKQKGVLR